MKDKPIKQPWPRSARVTVWVLLLLRPMCGFFAKKFKSTRTLHVLTSYFPTSRKLNG